MEKVQEGENVNDQGVFFFNLSSASVVKLYCLIKHL